MNPIFKILADSINITASIQSRLLELRTVDEAGMKSDTLSLELDDRDGIIELPRHGAQLEIWLGYQQTGLGKIGTYFVDETTLSGFPQTLQISAKAADFTGEDSGDIKAPQTRHFDNITIGDLVKTIAGEHSLTGKTAASLTSIVYAHLDQTAESNIHLLTRIASEHNAVAKVTNDLLIFAKAGESKSMSGGSLAMIVINKRDVSDYRASLTDRGRYKAVTATWHNKATAQNYSVSTSTEKPAFLLRHTYDSEQKAIEAAKAKLESLTQGTNTVEISLALGNPGLFAESPLILQGFRPGVSGPTWFCTRVEHEFSNSGFKTKLSGESKISSSTAAANTGAGADIAAPSVEAIRDERDPPVESRNKVERGTRGPI
jgi:phage protein D